MLRPTARRRLRVLNVVCLRNLHNAAAFVRSMRQNPSSTLSAVCCCMGRAPTKLLYAVFYIS